MYYPLHFNLSLVALNPWTEFRIIGSKSKFTSASPNLHSHPAFGTAELSLGKKTQTYYGDDQKKHRGVKFQDYLLILGWWLCKVWIEILKVSIALPKFPTAQREIAWEWGAISTTPGPTWKPGGSLALSFCFISSKFNSLTSKYSILAFCLQAKVQCWPPVTVPWVGSAEEHLLKVKWVEDMIWQEGRGPSAAQTLSQRALLPHKRDRECFRIPEKPLC